jgi:hypothetical protein
MLVSAYDKVVRCSHGQQGQKAHIMARDQHDDFTTKIIKAST